MNLLNQSCRLVSKVISLSWCFTSPEVLDTRQNLPIFPLSHVTPDDASYLPTTLLHIGSTSRNRKIQLFSVSLCPRIDAHCVCTFQQEEIHEQSGNH